MAFHISNLGSFGRGLTADINGYVPTAETTAWELTYDHFGQLIHDHADRLTEYGDWFENERFPEIKAEAIAATEEAIASLHDW